MSPAFPTYNRRQGTHVDCKKSEKSRTPIYVFCFLNHLTTCKWQDGAYKGNFLWYPEIDCSYS